MRRKPLPYPRSYSRILALIWAGVGLFCAATLSSAQNAAPNPVPPDPAQIVHNIDEAVRIRTARVAGYTVQELYSIYRNGETAPSAQVTVRTVYTRGIGKEYTTLTATGSSLLRSSVVDHVIANEKEMAKDANRDSVALTSANYEITPEPGIVQYNGHACVAVTLKARRKASYLFNGKGWFDASDFNLLHIEGSPAASPSFFAGQTSGTRDYTRIDGFSMALHAELNSHSFLFGSTIMKIDYSNYQIQSDPAAHGQ